MKKFFKKIREKIAKIEFSEAITEKRYRGDLNLWEEKIEIFGFFRVWRYQIRMKKLITRYSIFQKRPKTVRYIGVTPLPPIRVGRKEFEEKYHGNKYMVPINYELDLDLP